MKNRTTMIAVAVGCVLLSAVPDPIPVVDELVLGLGSAISIFKFIRSFFQTNP